MAAGEGKQWWDPYETSHRKHFIYRPNSAAEMRLRPMSTSFIASYSKSGPLGSTVYNKDFCWRPTCKPECIRTGTATGHRRNNPHPSQAFMMWRLPRDAARSSDYVALPWKCSLTEEEIRKALTAQYRSTYRCDFVGAPQGCDDMNKTGRRFGNPHNRRRVSLSGDTEMKANYRHPMQKPELLRNPSQYNCGTDPTKLCRGIVPTVIQQHVDTEQRGSDLTTYERFCGKRATNVASVVKSLLPQELQRLHRSLPAEGRDAVKTILKEDSCPPNTGNMDKLPAVVRNSRSPEWISTWTGPL